MIPYGCIPGTQCEWHGVGKMTRTRKLNYIRIWIDRGGFS
jgi:hypothetical protein